MKRNLQKVLAITLALALCAGHIALPTAAADADIMSISETVEDIDGGSRTVTEETGSEANEYGGLTTTDTTTDTWEQELLEGESVVEVEGSETTTHTQVNDSLGRPLYEEETVNGSETTTQTQDSTETAASREDPQTQITDNPYEEVPGADTDTGWIANSGTTEKDTYTDADISQDPGDVELNLTQKKSTVTETVMLDLQKAVEENIDIPNAGQTVTENPDGSQTTTLVEYIYGDDGKTVIGYTKSVTTVRTEISEDEDYTRGQTDTHTATATGQPEIFNSEAFLLPQEPEPGTVTHEDGSISVSTVEKILDENGNHIGYKTITVTTGADGLVTNSTQSVYGTRVQTQQTETTTETTVTETTQLTKDKVITTTSIRFQDAEGFELVWDGSNWVYTAQLGKVKEGREQGDIEITPLTPTSLVLNGKTYVVNRSDSTVTPAGHHNSPDGYDYNYTGVRGEGSIYDVETSQSYNSAAHMFQLKVGKDTFYVYCVDFNTTATPNFNYTMENVADATYYGESESKHIQAIGMYGYWGTTGTNSDGSPVTGSLAALKANLTAARQEATAAGKTFPLTQKQIDGMTEGEALTATQAAFWTYGNRGGVTIDKSQATQKITGLYQWLISLEAPTTESTDIIDKDEFAQTASITVKDKATNPDGSQKTQDGSDVYLTDVSFTIDVARSSLTGNLKVSIVQNGKVVEEIQLATADSNILGRIMSGGREVGTSVTFTDLELAEGVRFTVNLEGTQQLEEGVYIYTSEKIGNKSSQTFVGLASGEHTVDLAVDMTFSVTEPQLQVKDPGSSPGQTRVETQTLRKTDTETVTTTLEEITTDTHTVRSTGRLWDSSWSKYYSYPEYPADGHDEDPGDEEFTEIPDEEVPLANAPKTGDISLLFAAVSLISAGGLMLLRRGKED